MAQSDIQSELTRIGQAGQRSLARTPLVTTLTSLGICTLIGGLYGLLATENAELDSELQLKALRWVGVAVGLTIGGPGVLSLWYWAYDRFYRRLVDSANSNLLTRSLLLMVLEPVPAAELLSVLSVPGRESGALSRLPMPQSPQALNTQSFAGRLRLLLARYPACCKALGLTAWPRDFMELQLAIESARFWLPAVGAVLMLACAAIAGESMPQPLLFLPTAVLLVAITLRWALGDMLRGLASAAVHAVVAEHLGERDNEATEAGPAEQESPVEHLAAGIAPAKVDAG